MTKEFRLPDPGEGIHEAEIVEVLVSEGDRVEDGDPVLVIETDKATTEVPAPHTGTVKEIRVEAGEVVEVGDVLMVFELEGAAEAAPPEEPEQEGKEIEEEGEQIEEAERGEEPKAERRRKPKTEKRSKEGKAKRGKEGVSEEAEQRERRLPTDRPVPAVPSTRRLARELGVDLHDVRPSGPGGRVTSEDVRTYSKGERPEAEPARRKPEEKAEERPRRRPGAFAPEDVELPDFTRWGPVERQPLRSVRRATARRMARSWAQVPHVTHADVADITELERFRRSHKEEVETQGGALTLTVFILKAVVAALRSHPRFNASLDTAAEEIVIKQYYHLGVAVDTDRGLIVPPVRNVDRKSLLELARELPELERAAREGDLDREALSGGTFTITNVGAIGGTGFTPIINFPEVAILGLAKARLQQVVHGDLDRYEVKPRLILPLCLAFDHRVADGADAARFLNTVIEVLEDPETLMLEM